MKEIGQLDAIHFFKLNNGTLIPSLGLGTWKAEPGEVGEAVKAAIKLGYRHIDCAAAYRNQKEIGDALQEVIKSGIVKREDLWITSKLWNTEHDPEEVPAALDRCLHDLQLDYLDLYLVHWPVSLKKNGVFPPKQEDFAPLDLKSTWQAMEKLPTSKVRSIGVSNFSDKKVDDLISYAKVVPAVNQVECHPLWNQKRLKLAHERHNIHLTAYSPIGSGDSLDETVSVLNNPVIKDIAEKYHKSPAQVALRWGIQQGFSVIPKSVNPDRLRQNFAIFDFSLAPEDLEKISRIEQTRLLKGAFFCNDSTSPYKNPEELWDNDL